MDLILTTPPAAEPITKEEAKEHLRRSGTTSDDAYITSLIRMVRQQAETIQNRAFLTQTWTLWLREFPADTFIRLPRPPIQTVTHVKYYDSDDTATTFTGYRLDDSREPAEIVLKDGEDWPSADLRTAKGVEIQYVTGYTSSVEFRKQEEQVYQAMLIMLSHYYESREPIVTGTIVSKIPWSAMSLLSRERVVPV